MTTATAQLSESLQTLIDARLDTIDRMLLGRVPRQDRLAIAREVESQVFELLQERGGDPSRDDVLAVLGRLDPPEAYLPDSEDREAAPARIITPPRTMRSEPKPATRSAKASGILGIIGVTMVLFLPAAWMFAVAFNSSPLGIFILIGTAMTCFFTGLLATILGALSHGSGPWAMIGLVTGIIALVFTPIIGVVMLFMG